MVGKSRLSWIRASRLGAEMKIQKLSIHAWDHHSGEAVAHCFTNNYGNDDSLSEKIV
jgi:hypothetical protein